MNDGHLSADAHASASDWIAARPIGVFGPLGCATETDADIPADITQSLDRLRSRAHAIGGVWGERAQSVVDYDLDRDVYVLRSPITGRPLISSRREREIADALERVRARAHAAASSRSATATNHPARR